MSEGLLKGFQGQLGASKMGLKDIQEDQPNGSKGLSRGSEDHPEGSVSWLMGGDRQEFGNPDKLIP